MLLNLYKINYFYIFMVILFCTPSIHAGEISTRAGQNRIVISMDSNRLNSNLISVCHHRTNGKYCEHYPKISEAQLPILRMDLEKWEYFLVRCDSLNTNNNLADIALIGGGAALAVAIGLIGATAFIVGTEVFVPSPYPDANKVNITHYPGDVNEDGVVKKTWVNRTMQMISFLSSETGESKVLLSKYVSALIKILEQCSSRKLSSDLNNFEGQRCLGSCHGEKRDPYYKSQNNSLDLRMTYPYLFDQDFSNVEDNIEAIEAYLESSTIH